MEQQIVETIINLIVALAAFINPNYLDELPQCVQEDDYNCVFNSTNSNSRFISVGNEDNYVTIIFGN